jgi:hypothetical protein
MLVCVVQNNLLARRTECQVKSFSPPTEERMCSKLDAILIGLVVPTIHTKYLTAFSSLPLAK